VTLILKERFIATDRKESGFCNSGESHDAVSELFVGFGDEFLESACCLGGYYSHFQGWGEYNGDWIHSGFYFCVANGDH
jgi:hypothetical protein